MRLENVAPNCRGWKMWEQDFDGKPTVNTSRTDNTLEIFHAAVQQHIKTAHWNLCFTPPTDNN